MSVTVYNDVEYYWKKNNATNTKPKNSSFLEPAEISFTTMIYYIIVLFLSLIGIIVSVLLIIGLYFEIRLLLTPWMMVVIVSSLVDVSHSIYWLTLDNPNFVPLTAIFFTVEIFIVVLNGYALLCVLSQYQEYKAGRGTAAYNNLLETIRLRNQVPLQSVRCSQQQTTGTSYLTTTTASHLIRDFNLPRDCSIQNTSLVTTENVKSRRVQFSKGEESNMILSTNIFNDQLSENEKSCVQDSDDEKDDDYVVDRSEYLWCDIAEERILISGLTQSHRHENIENRCSMKSDDELSIVKKENNSPQK
ncbi:hypothetical protein PGB90_000687 [Kerria lacca]